METSVTSKDGDDLQCSDDKETAEENQTRDKILNDEDDEKGVDIINTSRSPREQHEATSDAKEEEDDDEMLDDNNNSKMKADGDGVENKMNKDRTNEGDIYTDETKQPETKEQESNKTKILRSKEDGNISHNAIDETSPSDSKTKDAKVNSRSKPLTDSCDSRPSQPRTIAATSNSIIIDLSISQVMGDATPRSRGSHTAGGERWNGGACKPNRPSGACKSVDFSFPANMEDDVDDELARVIINAANDNQSLFDLHEYGRGATTNTPVTVVTDYAESQIQGRGLHTPSREHLYQHALTIMKKRCHSSRTGTSNIQTFYRPKTPDNVVEENGTAFPVLSLPAVIAGTKEPPLVRDPNQLFYVAQKRQHPIAPIKAWTGYHGNVYFQPMLCKKADLTPSSTPRENALNMATRRVYSRPIMKPKSAESESMQLPQLPQSEIAGGDGPITTNTALSVAATEIQSIHDQHSAAPSSRERSYSRAASTAKSRASTARQLAVLDKQSVFHRMDSNIREDIQWISGLEAMGTLHLGGLKRPRSTARFYKNTEKHHKLKIQRGLVSHQLAAHNQSLPTLLGIHGGKLNDSADSVAKTKHLESQYQACKASKPDEGHDDSPAYSPNLFGGYSGPFTSIEQLRRDSSSSPLKRGNSNTSSEQLLKDDSLHTMASAYKNSVNTVPMYSSKEVLFRNREALFLTRPNYR